MSGGHVGQGDETGHRKRAAALEAVAEVRDDMVVGLGTGTTASLALEALARRVVAGLRVVAIPTSEAIASRARALGVPLTSFADHQWIDLAIDGADEIERAGLDLIKGLGGALLREKIVACASRRLLIVADESKLVDRLGNRVPVPVEVAAFGVEATARRLERLGATVTPRAEPDGSPYVTDGGNRIVDCAFGPITDVADLEGRLRGVVGVVETGLFVGIASEAIVAGRNGVRRLHRA